MAGQVVTIIPRTRYSLAGDTSTQSEIQLGARAFDAADWASVVLVVRLHALDVGSRTASVQVGVYNVSISPDDPATLFRINTSLAQISFASADSAPALHEAAITRGPIGPMLGVTTTFQQGSGLGQCVWEMSVELVGREGRLAP